MPTIGEVISFVAAPVGGAAGALATGPAAAPPRGRRGTAIDLRHGWGRENGLFARAFLQLQLKPSFSISKTDKSFFFIRSMMALMSLSSKGASFPALVRR